MKHLLTIFISLALVACTGTRPVQLGTENTNLDPCPEKPNCVNSLANQADSHFIKPLIAKNPANAHQTLVEIISQNPQAEIIVSSPSYIYAEYTSNIMKFVDDVEFLFSKDNNDIHVRSASRLGYRDFDVNRERIEAIRSELNQ